MIVVDLLTFLFVISIVLVILLEGLLIYGSLKLIEKRPGISLMLTLLAVVVPLFLLLLII